MSHIEPPPLSLRVSWLVRRITPPIAAVFLAAAFVTAATVKWDLWASNSTNQTTDDAYVRAETTRLSSRVAGEVKVVKVNDFQRVKAGDLLLQIDPADYEAQVSLGEAGLAAAQATLDNLANQIELQHATIAQADAQRTSAEALSTQANQELDRQASLALSQSGTRQRLEQAVAAQAKALGDLKASRAMVAAHRHQLDVLIGMKRQRVAEVSGADATLRASNLKLSYTRITAAFDGVVSERQVQQGDYVDVGTNLISVVPLPDVYVIANFKETQLTRVRPGQPVDIVVDTFSSHTMTGYVERISPASGSQFSLLPPDNASGNFTKVVQRVPVRIRFDKDQQLIDRLLPGMSVTARIKTRTPS